jgi:hypothetical protein
VPGRSPVIDHDGAVSSPTALPSTSTRTRRRLTVSPVTLTAAVSLPLLQSQVVFTLGVSE